MWHVQSPHMAEHSNAIASAPGGGGAGGGVRHGRVLALLVTLLPPCFVQEMVVSVMNIGKKDVSQRAIHLVPWMKEATVRDMIRRGAVSLLLHVF